MSITNFNNYILRTIHPVFLTRRIGNLKHVSLTFRNKSDITTYKEQIDPDSPIAFSTSKAASWKTNYKNLQPEVDTETLRNEKIKRVILILSYSIFLAYVFVREGNDLDDEMSMPLGKRVLTLHTYQLELEKEELIKNKDSTDEVDSELLRIANLKKKYSFDN